MAAVEVVDILVEEGTAAVDSHAEGVGRHMVARHTDPVEEDPGEGTLLRTVPVVDLGEGTAAAGSSSAVAAEVGMEIVRLEEGIDSGAGMVSVLGVVRHTAAGCSLYISTSQHKNIPISLRSSALGETAPPPYDMLAILFQGLRHSVVG